MKKRKLVINILIVLWGIVIFNACNKPENDKKGFVTFGANYHTINCMTTVTIYIDNNIIGTLDKPTDSIIDCEEESNITKELSIGEHAYKIEIRPETGTGCTKDINGTFMISENKCEKIFIDYLQVFGNQSDCDQNVIISETEYNNATSDPFSITNMEISGNCLTITFSASGCDGSTWDVRLMDSEAIAESYPCQRTLKLILHNKEVCNAVISKEISFNIEGLQIEGNDKVILNVSGEKITYEYCALQHGIYKTGAFHPYQRQSR